MYTALKFVALDDMRRMKEPNLSTIGRQNKFPVKSFTRCTKYLQFCNKSQLPASEGKKLLNLTSKLRPSSFVQIAPFYFY